MFVNGQKDIPVMILFRKRAIAYDDPSAHGVSFHRPDIILSFEQGIVM
jgi:hypothetical protein